MVTKKTFRLRGVPIGSNEEHVRDLVQRALGCPEDVNIQVRSLAGGPYLEDEMMATFEISPIPEILNQGPYLKVRLDSRRELEFDSNFIDFTALHTPAEGECTIE